MAKRKKNVKWSLLVIPEPSRSAKQYHLSRRTMLLLPAAAVLAAAGSLIALEARSELRLRALEGKHAEEAGALSSALAAKEKELALLKRELDRLAGEAAAAKASLRLRSETPRPDAAFDRRDSGASSAAAAGAPVAKLSLEDAAAAAGSDRPPDETAEPAETSFSPSAWPTDSKRLSSGFGYRKDPFTGKSALHAGVDISGEIGDPVYASGSGTVKETGEDGSRGHYIILAHGGEIESWYLHLDEIEVKQGDAVRQGEQIGRLGNTGRSTGPHLHFQVVEDGEAVNPLPYIAKED